MYLFVSVKFFFLTNCNATKTGTKCSRWRRGTGLRLASSSSCGTSKGACSTFGQGLAPATIPATSWCRRLSPSPSRRSCSRTSSTTASKSPTSKRKAPSALQFDRFLNIFYLFTTLYSAIDRSNNDRATVSPRGSRSSRYALTWDAYYSYPAVRNCDIPCEWWFWMLTSWLMGADCAVPVRGGHQQPGQSDAADDWQVVREQRDAHGQDFNWQRRCQHHQERHRRWSW